MRRWFITGGSSGFGRELARVALRRGDSVWASVRKPEQIALLKKEGIPAVVMDVNDDARINAAIGAAIADMGGVDVLVNNAGFGLMGAIEALDLAEIREVMETNFFGALRVTQAFLPQLRKSAGVIVNISSVAGQMGIAGVGAYCASKFALEGLSEALAEELAPFGVRVLIVEPGAFRTDFSGRSMKVGEASVAAYAGTQAGEGRSLLEQYHGHEPGDPVRGVEAIFAAVQSDKMPLRLVLGADALAGIEAKYLRLKQDLEEWRAVSLATAFD